MNNSDYRMLRWISEHYSLIVDTREKLNRRYYERMDNFEKLGIEAEREKLDFGDYSAIADTPTGYIDYTHKIVIERKMDLEELIMCLSTDHDRFKNELQRAHDCGCKMYIATESGSYADIVAGNYKNHVSPKLVLTALHVFEQRYDCKFVFLTPETFPIFVHETLRRFIMEDLTRRYYGGTSSLF